MTDQIDFNKILERFKAIVSEMVQEKVILEVHNEMLVNKVKELEAKLEEKKEEKADVVEVPATPVTPSKK